LPDRPTDAGPVRILHAHSTFALGGKEARAVRLMNAFGERAQHVILSATDQFGAREAIAPTIAADFPGDAPSLVGKPGPLRYRRLARYLRGFDLVLTYNWGAMDVVAARRLFGGPPLVHHEDGFNEDEAERRNPKRNGFRRLFLPAAHRLVVPSQRLEAVARAEWKQPPGRVVRIPNGIPFARFQPPPTRPIPGLLPGGGPVVGTVAGLRAVKNLPRLVRAFAAAAPQDARLVIVGEGPERDAIAAAARQAGVADRLVMPGFMADPAAWIGHFDLFALSSNSEQFPISLIEAMAAGLPCAAMDVGDIRDMVSEPNRFAIGDEAVLTQALARLLADPDLRRSVGEANRRLAAQAYDEAVMISRYATLYAEAIGRAGALGSGATAA
jgi:glycosyltransferase involved in cell wall biosynthesis